MDIRRMGSNKQSTQGNIPDVRTSQPTTPSPAEPIALEPVPIDLPTIEEPETAAPLVLAIVDELTADPNEATPKKAKLHPSTKITTKTVEIKISIPAVPVPNLKPITEHRAYVTARAQAAKVPRKKLALSGIILAVLLFTIGTNILSNNDSRVTAGPSTANKPPDLVSGVPNYAVMLPSGKTFESYKGATWVNSSKRNPVFVYVDSIGTADINISQQPLPDDFKSNPDSKIEELAVGFKANQKVSAGSSTVYIGTSENGYQSLVFHKNNLLVLMTSKTKIPTDRWIEYINSLK